MIVKVKVYYEAALTPGCSSPLACDFWGIALLGVARKALTPGCILARLLRASSNSVSGISTGNVLPFDDIGDGVFSLV